MMIKVVTAVLFGCVAVALADSYVTESYETEAYATPTYQKNDGYGYDASYVYDRRPYGYVRKYDKYGRRDYGYGRKDYGYGYDRRDYGYGYDRKDYGYGYDSKDSYAHEDKYAYPSYDAPRSYDAPKETYGYKDTKYSYCDTYGSGSYMYNMCRKCASYSEKFTCEKAYYPAQSYTVKTKPAHVPMAQFSMRNSAFVLPDIKLLKRENAAFNKLVFSGTLLPLNLRSLIPSIVHVFNIAV
ncbi:unnamed protein product [Owenia fusiformis]|uniref:Uncharacterized protein n=1 Tax=Owenia fusiformis TaxID=6347 RepID=A0A8J1USW3_OWEFU|nr:unnamed protein product [Owenia fusiformis]